MKVIYGSFLQQTIPDILLVIDYDETVSPRGRLESVCTVIALATMNGLTLHQIDTTTAFLHGDLKEEVYMKQPEGFLVEDQEH